MTLLIWLMYTLSMATVGTDAMTAYGSEYQGNAVDGESELSEWTRDESGEWGGRRLSDGRNPR
jgi:hypothetical protein